MEKIISEGEIRKNIEDALLKRREAYKLFGWNVEDAIKTEDKAREMLFQDAKEFAERYLSYKVVK